MYIYFAIHPIAEILHRIQIEALPPKLDYIFAILAFAMEAFLFWEHLHGRSRMDTQLHTYLVYAIILCMGSAILEMIFTYDVRPAICRSVFTLLQGTWFYQVKLLDNNYRY